MYNVQDNVLGGFLYKWPWERIVLPWFMEKGFLCEATKGQGKQRGEVERRQHWCDLGKPLWRLHQPDSTGESLKKVMLLGDPNSRQGSWHWSAIGYPSFWGRMYVPGFPRIYSGKAVPQAILCIWGGCAESRKRTNRFTAFLCVL